MHKKTEIEMEQYKLLKAYRTIIRLKHSLAADEELNEVLPAALEELEKSIQSGELKQLQIASLNEVLNADS